MDQERRKLIAEKFTELWGVPPSVMARGPGRVNLIGEHTDYNDGFVLPVAIDLDVVVAARPRQDRQVNLYSLNFRQASAFNLDAIGRDSDCPWSNYVRGVALVLEKAGFRLRGMEAVIQGTVPIGAGLSSSAATELAAAYAFQAISGFELDDRRTALLCRQAENEFVGMQCGIMDQLAGTLGQESHALLIDCRDLSCQPVPWPSDLSIVVCDTMKRRELVNSAYNRRRLECERAVRLLARYVPGITSLRDVSPEVLDLHGHRLPEIVRRRAKHVLSENQRVLEAVVALQQADGETFGRLLDESHSSLRHDYQVSCHELDLMVHLARSLPGCLGARMTGAGFGGCTVNVVKVDAVPVFVPAVLERYLAATGTVPQVFVCRPGTGASRLP